MVPRQLLLIPLILLYCGKAFAGVSFPVSVSLDFSYRYGASVPYYYNRTIMARTQTDFASEIDFRGIDDYGFGCRLDLGDFSLFALLPLRNTVVIADVWTLQGARKARFSSFGPGNASLAAEQRFELPFDFGAAVRGGVDIPNTNGTNSYWEGRNPSDRGLAPWLSIRASWSVAGWNRVEAGCRWLKPGKGMNDMQYDWQDQYEYGIQRRLSFLDTFSVPMPEGLALSLFVGAAWESDGGITLLSNKNRVTNTAATNFYQAAGFDFTVQELFSAGVSVFSADHVYLTNRNASWGFMLRTSFRFGTGSGAQAISLGIDDGIFGPE